MTQHVVPRQELYLYTGHRLTVHGFECVKVFTAERVQNISLTDCFGGTSSRSAVTASSRVLITTITALGRKKLGDSQLSTCLQQLNHRFDVQAVCRGESDDASEVAGSEALASVTFRDVTFPVGVGSRISRSISPVAIKPAAAARAFFIARAFSSENCSDKTTSSSMDANYVCNQDTPPNRGPCHQRLVVTLNPNLHTLYSILPHRR
jgi:hypothetical protein